jgi:hypothetical protein
MRFGNDTPRLALVLQLNGQIAPSRVLKHMSTHTTKPMITFALAVATLGVLGFSSAAEARYHHRYYGPLHHYGYYGGSYGYTGRARVPVYNPHDAHRLSRQTVGVGD